MPGPYLTPYSGRISAVCVATWLLVLSHGGPAFASSNLPSSGDSQDGTPPDVPADQLHASEADHEFGAEDTTDDRTDDADAPLVPANYHLTPEAETALRRLFRNGVEQGVEQTPDVESAVEQDEPAAIKTRVPGVSDAALERYKRNMYRRDI